MAVKRRKPKVVDKDGPDELLADVLFCAEKIGPTAEIPSGPIGRIDWLGYIDDLCASVLKLHAHLARGGARPKAWAAAQSVSAPRQAELVLPVDKKGAT
jgi:hypothetical protein